MTRTRARFLRAGADGRRREALRPAGAAAHARRTFRLEATHPLAHGLHADPELRRHLASGPTPSHPHDVHGVGTRCARAGAARTPGWPRSHPPPRPRQPLPVDPLQRAACRGQHRGLSDRPATCCRPSSNWNIVDSTRLGRWPPESTTGASGNPGRFIRAIPTSPGNSSVASLWHTVPAFSAMRARREHCGGSTIPSLRRR